MKEIFLNDLGKKFLDVIIFFFLLSTLLNLFLILNRKQQ